MKERNFRGAKGDIATVIDSPILSRVARDASLVPSPACRLRQDGMG